ncbi:MAG TPA: sulfatase [bacterium]|nr:sulfatase [bacterium]
MLRSLVPAVAIGLLGGFLAGKWQIAILRFGDIAVDQLVPYWRFFLGGGVALAALGWLAAYAASGVIGRGRGLISTAGAAAAVAAGAALFVPNNVRERPDVLFLITDTTRADHLSVYGYDRPTTRYLEEIAGSSVIFDQALSQGSHTIVSTPCILASLYPSDHGLIGYQSKLWDGFLLVSEILKFAGYSTFGVVTNPHLSKANGFDQGWDSYEMLGSGTSVAVFAERVNAAALTRIDSLRTEAPEPIFGMLFYTDPHTPYAAPDEYRRLYDPDWPGTPLVSWSMRKSGPPRPPQLRNLIANYDATITYWDDQLRALADSLETRGIAENLLLVYTSDHGEEFLDHGGFGHGLTLFEEVVHVPLLFSFPVPVKRPRLSRTHRNVSEVVSSVDIVPTLTDYLRVPVSHEMR